MANLECFTFNNKPVTYTQAFLELYNWRKYEHDHGIYKKIELEKMCTSTAKNLYSLSAHSIIKISLVLYSAYMVLKNQNKFIFYANNYIDCDWFNQLYDPDWMKKDIKDMDTFAYRIRPALTKAINDKLEVVRERKWKREEIMEKRKAKAIAAKQCKARGEISLSNRKKNESDIGDDMDLN